MDAKKWRMLGRSESRVPRTKWEVLADERKKRRAQGAYERAGDRGDE